MRLDLETSEQAIDQYLYAADAVEEFERRRQVLDQAVEAICNGLWLTTYEHWDDVTIPGAVVLGVTPEEVLTWRVNGERPGLVQIMYVGYAPYAADGDESP